MADERVTELADELQDEYPNHVLTTEVVDAVEGTSPLSDKDVGELILDSEQLLEGVDKQLKQILKTMDDLGYGSVVVIESFN